MMTQVTSNRPRNTIGNNSGPDITQSGNRPLDYALNGLRVVAVCHNLASGMQVEGSAGIQSNPGELQKVPLQTLGLVY